MTYPYTQLLEYIKCSEDPTYFIETYTGVKLDDMQKQFILHVLEYKSVLGDFERAKGKSMLATRIMLWRATFKANENLVLMAHTHQAGTYLMKTIEGLYLRLPKFMRPTIRFKNATCMEFDNGVRLATMYPRMHALRGMTVNHLWFDEPQLAKQLDLQEMLVCVWPCLAATGAKITFTGTDVKDVIAEIIKVDKVYNAASERRLNDITKRLWTYNG
jgi:hypothetical protein